MHNIRQGRNCRRNQFKLFNTGFKLSNALIFFCRNLAKLLLKRLPGFRVLAFRLKLRLLSLTLKFL
jgi:hypothetical protein